MMRICSAQEFQVTSSNPRCQKPGYNFEILISFQNFSPKFQNLSNPSKAIENTGSLAINSEYSCESQAWGRNLGRYNPEVYGSLKQ